MIDLGPTTEAEMVLEFVRAEMDSPKYRPGYDGEILRHGWDKGRLLDPEDPTQAARRATLLKLQRGYPDELLFTGFPLDTRWQRVELQEKDTSRLCCVADNGWRSLTESSFRVEDAARNIDRIHVTDINVNVREIIQRLDEGARSSELGVLLAVGHGSRLILLEGTKRATAYLARGQLAGVPAIIGASDRLGDWCFLPP